MRPSSKHVGVTPGTELWTIDVVKWFIADVLKVKWQSLALSSIYTGLVTSGWLSKWGTTTGCKTSLMYQWILRHVLKFQPRRANHHAKRDRRCRSDSSGRLMTPWRKSSWFQTVSNCSCWQTSIRQPLLFEYGTGCEWHPSN
jgi:hypothetical protein